MKRLNLSKALFAFSSLFLAFAVGLRVGETYQLSILTLARNAYSTLATEAAIRTGFSPVPFLMPARQAGSGVTRFAPGRSEPGLTLFTGFFEGGNEIRLIQLDGSLVRRWPVRFYDLFPDPSHIAPSRSVPATDWNTIIHGALALPDGSVVFNFQYGGLVKLDRCGVVQWKLPTMSHHSVEPSQDGGFWVPGRRWVSEQSQFPPLGPPYWEDTVLEVSPQGQITREISVPEILFKNDLQGILLGNGSESVTMRETELVHLNDIEELRAEDAALFPQFQAGDLLLSLRDLNLVLVMDPDTGTVRWHQVGPWLRQHDPDFLGDGTIGVFSNNADNTDDGSVLGGSRILVIDPLTRAVRIRYGSKPHQHMYTRLRGKHEAIGTSNILITEPEAGRAFEVDSAGRTVWEFVNRYDQDSVALLMQATRYPEDYFTVEDWTCDAAEAGS